MKWIVSPGLTPSMQSSVSMMAAISLMSMTPLLSMSYSLKAHFSLSSSEHWWLNDSPPCWQSAGPSLKMASGSLILICFLYIVYNKKIPAHGEYVRYLQCTYICVKNSQSTLHNCFKSTSRENICRKCWIMIGQQLTTLGLIGWLARELNLPLARKLINSCLNRRFIIV